MIDEARTDRQTDRAGDKQQSGGLDHDIISVPYSALTPVSQHSPPSEDVWSHLGLGGHFPLEIADL